MRTAWLIVLLFTALPALPGLAQESKAREELEQGERLHAAGDKEKAAACFHRARIAARRMPAGRTRSDMEKQITRLLKKADPRGAVHAVILDRCANDLIKLAERYEKANWLDTAEVLLRQAASLNPELAREPLERLTAQKNELRLARKETVGEAVELALDWLARHQQPDKGHWDGDDFYQLCQGEPCTGKAYPLYDVGLTGLSVLAFLGKGYTHQDGRYKDVLTRALDYLKSVQDPAGCFGAQTGHFTYNHCIATLALAEALQKTKDPALRKLVEQGTAFLLKAQHREPSTGNRLGWRYEVHPKDNDTSVTGWAVRALAAAKAAGVKVPDAALDGALAWIDRMIDPATGRVGYASQGVSPARQSVKTAEKWPPKLSEAITAIGIVARCQLGKNAKDDMIARGIGLCMERLPEWNEKSGAVDMYFWYYGTQALKLAGGDRFSKWFDALKRALIFHQCQDGCSRGSWDPVGPWGSEGGRIYSTALMALALEDGLDG